MNGHVFVSHGSDDRVQANELAAFIEAKGAKAWIAPRNVRPGQDYSEQLQEAIEKCSAFLVLVTDKANRSPYVRAEVEMAFSLFKPIFPVRMADVKPAAGLALFLKIRHWTDAFGEDKEANLARLAREVQTAAGVEVDASAVVEEAEARAAAARAGPIAAAPAPVPPTSAPAPPPPPPPPPPVYAPPPAYPAYPGHQPQAAMPTVPTAPTVALPPHSVPADLALLQTAVGPNAVFYLDRWARMDAKGSATSWNWPACLFNFFWFAYRKMWLPMAGVFVATFALLMITGTNPDFAGPFWLFSAGIGFAAGTFANYLYRQQVEKLIEETAPLGRAAQLEALARRGGVSWLSLVLTFAAIGGAVTLSILATTGLTPRVGDPDTKRGNETAPVAANGVTPAPPPPPGIPGYDAPPQDGTQPQQPPQPPETGPQDQGTGDETPPDDGSSQQDEARQDEIVEPQAS